LDKKDAVSSSLAETLSGDTEFADNEVRPGEQAFCGAVAKPFDHP
jgi:hypothetical protein